jgi:hypothetical protein
MVRRLTFFVFLSLFAIQAVAQNDKPIVQSASDEPSAIYVKSMQQWVIATDFAKNASEVVVAKLKLDMESDPKLQKSVTPALMADLKQYFYELFVSEKMTKELAKAYSQFFTLDDMSDLVKFYKSPLGQKVIRSTPALSLQSEKIGLALLKEHQRDYMEIVAKHIKKDYSR